VVDEKILAKIQRIYYCNTRIKKPNGRVYEYRLWHGYYREGVPGDGVFHKKAAPRKRVYIGKELPECLKYLIPKWGNTKGVILWQDAQRSTG